jgi:hypothetical protein
MISSGLHDREGSKSGRLFQGKRPFGRPRRRRENNIKMDLREIGLGGWILFVWLGIGTGGGLL